MFVLTLFRPKDRIYLLMRLEWVVKMGKGVASHLPRGGVSQSTSCTDMRLLPASAKITSEVVDTSKNAPSGPWWFNSQATAALRFHKSFSSERACVTSTKNLTIADASVCSHRSFQ